MRAPWRIAPLLAACVIAHVALTACVPTPTGRSTAHATPGRPTAIPAPTPAGPTPSPSFVRPTPTPLPTFLVYVVQPGDSLEGIADDFRTTGRSIAQWNRVTYPSLDPLSEAYEPDRIVVGWRLRLVPGREYDSEELPEPSG